MISVVLLRWQQTGNLPPASWTSSSTSSTLKRSQAPWIGKDNILPLQWYTDFINSLHHSSEAFIDAMNNRKDRRLYDIQQVIP